MVEYCCVCVRVCVCAQEFVAKWQDRDETNNFFQKHDVDLIKEELRPIVFEEIRQQVCVCVCMCVCMCVSLKERERERERERGLQCSHRASQRAKQSYVSGQALCMHV